MTTTTAVKRLLETAGIEFDESDALGDCVLIEKKDLPAAREALGEDAAFVAVRGNTVFSDGAYRGPRTNVIEVLDLDGGLEFYLIQGSDWSTMTIEEALAPFVLKHPRRVSDALGWAEGFFVNHDEDYAAQEPAEGVIDTPDSVLDLAYIGLASRPYPERGLTDTTWRATRLLANIKGSTGISYDLYEIVYEDGNGEQLGLVSEEAASYLLLEYSAWQGAEDYAASLHVDTSTLPAQVRRAI